MFSNLQNLYIVSRVETSEIEMPLPCDMETLSPSVGGDLDDESDNGMSWAFMTSPNSLKSEAIEAGIVVRQESTGELSDCGNRDRDSVNGSDWSATLSEKLMPKSTSIKANLSNFYQRLESAYPLLHVGQRESIEQCIDLVNQVIVEVWEFGGESVSLICEHMQKCGIFDCFMRMFIKGEHGLRLPIGKLLESYLTAGNVTYLVRRGFLHDLVRTLIVECDKIDDANIRLALALFEVLFRHGGDVGKDLVEMGALDYIIDVCKTQLMKTDALQHASVALSNLAIFGNQETHSLMIKKQIHIWLYVLVTHEDPRVRYYACLTISAMASTRANERTIQDTGVLPLVLNFIRSNKPDDIARLDKKHGGGRSKHWLSALSPLLNSSLSEVVCVALFQFVMEASIRKGTTNIEIFDELSLVSKIQDVASCPPLPYAGELADRLLAIIGEPVSYRLSQAVPIWTPKDVNYWVKKVGFMHHSDAFTRHRVDGDLLLRTNDEHLKNEIKISSAYERMRFLRELKSLKRTADYNCVDPTGLDMWLTRLDPDLSVYTYQMLIKGLDRSSLTYVDDETLVDVCGIDNPIYRTKILHTLKEMKHVCDADVALLRKQVDIFISYRRSNGSQLASLLKVHLQLKGFKVFLDVDRLFAGQFDKSLLDNIRAAKHFILILTPKALDPCVGDVDCKDWVHLEIKTALEARSNIVPIVEKNFQWPEVRTLPTDIQVVCSFNAIQWVHEYQDACIEKINAFLTACQTKQFTEQKFPPADIILPESKLPSAGNQ